MIYLVYIFCNYEVNVGHYTPYYYIGDGQRISFVRVGDESLPATAEQMVRLVLKGSNKTYDSLHTNYKIEDYAFTIIANVFKDVILSLQM